ELPEHDEHHIHDGIKRYKRGKARSVKRGERSPSAWYWNSGEEISEDGGKRTWMCTPCWETKKFTHFAQNSNRTIAKHLKAAHNITQSPSQLEDIPADNNASSIFPSFSNWEILKLRLIEWVVVMHITFSQVENNWFRRFLATLSPSLEKCIPRAGNTLRGWIMAEFERRREEIKNRLKSSKSRIHLSF